MLDVLRDLVDHVAEIDAVFVLDSDCVFRQAISARVHTRIASEKAILYTINCARDYVVNGLSPDEMAKIEREIEGKDPRPDEAFLYHGGELICLRGDQLATVEKEARHVLATCLERHTHGKPKYNEEAHLLSHVYRKLGYPSFGANQEKLIRRLWTDRSITRNIQGNDEDLTIWHLPSEKRVGFSRYFECVQKSPLALRVSAQMFRIQEQPVDYLMGTLKLFGKRNILPFYRDLISLEKHKKRFTRFLYWLATRGPAGQLVGLVGSRKVFDGMGLMTMPNSVDREIISSLFFQCYERPERILIEKYLDPTLNCVELGSSLGYISRVIKHKLNVDRVLVQVEADPILHAIGSDNAHSLTQGCRVASLNAAVDYGKSETTYFYSDGHTLGGRTCDLPSAQQVPVMSLEKILNEFAIDDCNLVMDIEGMEYALLKHEARFLQQCCRVIIVELHYSENHRRKFVQLLESLDFDLEKRFHNVFAFHRRDDHS